jgi:mono/diheme cytochrome c family protein
VKNVAPLFIALLALTLSGCDQRMIHQPKDKAYEASRLFANGRVEQVPPAGTVARDALFWSPQTAPRPPMSAGLLARGQERFDIFCAPCHSRTGDGDGMVVQRGMPRPPSFHSSRLREAPDRHFLQVITDGYGAMYSYATRVPPDDRWAITAYIRALQLSRHAEVATLPDELREALQETER